MLSRHARFATIMACERQSGMHPSCEERGWLLEGARQEGGREPREAIHALLCINHAAISESPIHTPQSLSLSLSPRPGSPRLRL